MSVSEYCNFCNHSVWNNFQFNVDVDCMYLTGSPEAAAATWVTTTSPSAARCTTTTGSSPGTRSVASTWTSTRSPPAAPVTSWATATCILRSRRMIKPQLFILQHQHNQHHRTNQSIHLYDLEVLLILDLVLQDQASSVFHREIHQDLHLHNWRQTLFHQGQVPRNQILTILFLTLTRRRNFKPSWILLEMISKILILNGTDLSETIR